ncbi:Phosphoribosylamine--glycine ligase [uncultured archaeon]|nr:Phosphoribosylamine--glycine ligase [uncultured archaeon]
MKVLLVGGGGREHAIADAITRSRKNPELYAAMSKKNPGIARLCKDFLLVKETDPTIIDYAVKNKIELAVIGPEAPLAAGIPDLLWDAGIPVVGPRKLAAQIEFDKAWTREFMKKYDIPGCPGFKVFRKGESGTDEYIDELGDVVIKPAGLTGGKGVRVMGDHFDINGAKVYAREVLKNDDLVIEERLIGEEFTVQAFVDGNTLAYAPSVQDHKRAYEGDKGPNTGGMGSYNDSKDILPFMKESDYTDAQKIMKDTVLAIKKETSVPYQGVLYGQFMATAKGISVIEFNARFGDPEAMNVLPILENDFLDVCDAVVNGTLDNIRVTFKKQATVCKYAVPAGYPDNPVMDSVIETGELKDTLLFYSSVYEKDNKIYTTGSRAIAVLGIADGIGEAEKKAQEGLSILKGALYSRRDIGTSELIMKRIRHMEELRLKMENEKPETEKDAVLAKLEKMLENMSEKSRQPILDLINKRKVELGLLKSELKPVGYILKKGRAKPKPKPQTKESKESLRKIAENVGRVKEINETGFHDVDVKDEPLKKDKKPLEEVDSYKY